MPTTTRPLLIALMKGIITIVTARTIDRSRDILLFLAGSSIFMLFCQSKEPGGAPPILLTGVISQGSRISGTINTIKLFWRIFVIEPSSSLGFQVARESVRDPGTVPATNTEVLPSLSVTMPPFLDFWSGVRNLLEIQYLELNEKSFARSLG